VAGIAAIAVIRDERGRVLLVQQTRGPFAGSWLLPGGRAGDDESAGHALVREIRDAWFASAPTQTIPNRAFAGAATSLGQVRTPKTARARSESGPSRARQCIGRLITPKP